MQDLRFTFCRVQKWQREQEQICLLLAEVRKIHRTSLWQHVLSRLSTLFKKAPRTSEQMCNESIPRETVVSEEVKLIQDGFTSEEIAIIYKFRRWYQTSGREDIAILRHWEFLKLLVNNGKLEV